MPPPLQVTMIGGGMIAHDQILPSLYHLQRLGFVGPIRIAARHSKLLRELAEAPTLAKNFPGQTFEAHPPLTEDPHKSHPEMYKRIIERSAGVKGAGDRSFVLVHAARF